MALIILLALGVGIMIYCAYRGAKNGLIHELNSVATLVCAMIIFNIVADIMNRTGAMSLPVALVGALLLIITIVAYGLFLVLFKTVHIFARLPVIRIIDNILGFFGGILEGIVVLYLADSLLRYFVF